MLKNKLDRSSFTMPSEGRELSNYATATAALTNAYKRKTYFNVRVLSRVLPISSRDAATVLGGGSTIASDASIDRVTFMGRALGDSEIPSVHYPWPDPCKLDYGKNEQIVARIIMAHTTFISRTGYSGKIPAVGDIVKVNFKPGDFSYNLQYAHFDTIEEPNMPEATKFNDITDCTRLKTKFDNYDYREPFKPGDL